VEQVAQVLEGMARERGMNVAGQADGLSQGQGAVQHAAEAMAEGLRGALPGPTPAQALRGARLACSDERLCIFAAYQRKHRQ